MRWSHLPTGLSVAFIEDVTVAVTVAPASSCFCRQSVVNHPRVLQLGELTRDGFGGGEWAEREVAHPHG